MNTNDFKIFEAVAAHGSFTKAAGAMFTVQSNVTARIKSLEDEFAVSLFTRTSRKVELTAAGETLMHYFKQVGHLIEEAKRELSQSKQLIGHLKIGCIETTLALKAPDMINQFNETYPEIELEFRADMSANLIHDVINYKLDAAFVMAPVFIPDLAQQTIKEEQLVIVTSNKYAKINDAVHDKNVKIVVFDQGCNYRARLESWLSFKGIVNYKNIVVNSLEGIINFVEADLAITILPADLIAQYYQNRKLKTFAIGKELGTSTTVLIYRKNRTQDKLLKAFTEIYS
ncbi:DNA-binding transcriptional LysR family regulator [Pedobacter cryoconitis]|uniref:DNA-binding transcriptional LysR family regulator n=1 Tax=Pedobacter cryoconitis TaxID=188932 RepID=A0A7W8ZRC1_9SPHI|nr:LysR family transcriptional regulator [Pedobacter cryoconitis]MBB5638771.1 DNA-binding transcriptional LysR family regulator [Pedobacter cryoconitis]MBB6270219.1 DNA-binding transcriptional LysR family regulator [Pedobacter cryoconitis]